MPEDDQDVEDFYRTPLRTPNTGNPTFGRGRSPRGASTSGGEDETLFDEEIDLGGTATSSSTKSDTGKGW